MEQVPILETAIFVLQIFASQFVRIFTRVMALMVLAWTVLVLSFENYVVELQHLVEMPNDRIASLILGLIAGGVLLFLFFHSAISANITAALLQSNARTRFGFLHIGRESWRLYAARLRILLFVALALLALLGLDRVVAALSPDVELALKPWLRATAAAGWFLAAVRVGFLAPVLSIVENGQIVRRAWQLTDGHSLRLLAIYMLAAVPGMIVLLTGEFLLRAVGAFGNLPPTLSFMQAASLMGSVLPGYLVLVIAAYFIWQVLMCAAAIHMYRALRARPPTEPLDKAHSAAAPVAGNR